MPLCDTSFWDWKSSWDTPSPLLSRCFRQGAALLGPVALLWTGAILGLATRRLRRTDAKRIPLPWTFLTVAKLVSSVILVLCTSTELVYTVYDAQYGEAPVPPIDFVSPVVRLLSFILVMFLQQSQKQRGHVNSYLLSLFWIGYFVCELIVSPIFDVIFDNLDADADPRMFVVRTVAFSFVFAEMILSLFSDPGYDRMWDPLKDEYIIEHQPILSRLLYSWVSRLMWYGSRNKIEIRDLGAMNPDKRARNIHEQLMKRWAKEQQRRAAHKQGGCGRGPSLTLALGKTMLPWFGVAVLLELAYDFASLIPPVVLDLLIRFMDEEDEPRWHGYAYSLLLFVTAAASSLLMLHNLHYLICASIVPRCGLPAAVYRKMLRLSQGARRSYSLGEMCNLVTVDTTYVVQMTWSANMVWSLPLRVVLILALLWRYLGVACLAGAALIVLLMPLSGLVAALVHRRQVKQMELKDARLRHMNEILSGIKVIKLFAWELPFIEQVVEVRRKEASSLRKIAFLNGAVSFIWISAPFMVALCSFVTFVMLGNDLHPSTAFVSLTLFGKLRSAISPLPQTISELVQANIALKRIAAFLLSDDLKPQVEENATAGGNALEIDAGASFSWAEGEAPFLRDVSVSVAPGALAAVVGRVGAGKSALLAALLGEMHGPGAAVRVAPGSRVAYVSQQAWIQNATLRQNVLFVGSMEAERYEEVLDRCCLRPDLEVLPGGDLTEIGERGINLSGGQKQRVSLARALYQDADIYLLDDPLSAVDAHVGAELFKNVIGPRGALKNKTRILVTHDFSLLPEVDVIYLMSDGRIVESGSFRELSDRGGEFARLVDEHRRIQKEELLELEEDLVPLEATGRQLSTEELKEQMKKRGSRLSRSLSRQRSVEEPPLRPPKKPSARLIDTERMELGRVKASVFVSYFRNASYFLTFWVILGFVAFRGFEIGSNVWLSEWSRDEPSVDAVRNDELRNRRISVYGFLGLAQGWSGLVGTFVLALAATRASVRYHRTMLWSVLRSPMAFFDTTPLGRIINRFGKDLNSVDVNIPSCLSSVMSVVAGVIGSVALIAVKLPLFVAAVGPLALLYFFVQCVYMATSRQIRRLMSVTLSPVLSFFSESIQGVSTLRAYGAQRRFVRTQDQLLDTNCTAFFANTLVNRWLSIRLQLMGSVIVLTTSMLVVAQKGDYDAAVVGLVLSYALGVTDSLSMLVRQMTQLEVQMVSAERIDEYSELTPEASWETEQCCLSLTEWPREGAVSFKDYKMRYRPGTDLVLKGVNVDIASGEKVGVVGRTGAGKSSLALALFRIVEPDEGAIFIDGIDITALGLHDLRAKITVIPQDPVLFDGTLRMNLDPLNEFPDENLWLALEQAHLKQYVSGLDGGLDYKVAERGDNLSAGQQQQVCLARALLKRSKILVLDEATAAVDLETDKLIQTTIRSSFQGCTVITIAHRIYTILDYDRILVMDDGRIVEEGRPDVLLQKDDSAFSMLARAAGLL